MLRYTAGVGGCQISLKKALQRCTVQCYYHYEGMGGCQISRKKHYVTLEWPLTKRFMQRCVLFC